ncbi:hypothetical protein OXPF_00390 [Oxobacter pfennigii]|uniref:Uncharacterized protein n=1 Tax=Oxobacter pfennigii TaxID=36849 RepID=A0A0P8WDY9_9CLOT|nr:hypothetical protein OXPF_00390 [Oxobacter pfennigii]
MIANFLLIIGFILTILIFINIYINFKLSKIYKKLNDIEQQCKFIIDEISTEQKPLN